MVGVSAAFIAHRFGHSDGHQFLLSCRLRRVNMGAGPGRLCALFRTATFDPSTGSGSHSIGWLGWLNGEANVIAGSVPCSSLKEGPILNGRA